MNLEIDVKKLLEKTKEETTKLSEKMKDEFEYQIIKRGISYFKKKNVVAVYKNGKTYYSHVVSDNGIDEYNVKIAETEDGIGMECNCPYQYPCKHEYATLLAIDNKDINESELLPEPEYISYDLHDIIEKIPSDELKKYIIERVAITRLVFNDMETFNKRFNKYIPIQKEEYYYNRLYNLLVMKMDVNELINDYMDIIKQYIDYKNYKQAFVIIRSLVNAFYKVEKNTSLEQVEDGLIAKLGMYSRIVYRKIEEEEKQKISDWINELIEQDFFNDVYLEDMVLTIK
ncbi:MAG: SWIM zinc finger domain-containing protein [Bacilli bacterium]